MALRVYTDREGQEWTVWRVHPSHREESPLLPRFREGWLCFQRADGTGRCRLPLDDVPPGWDALPDDRLDLLRRIAEQPAPSATPSTTGRERQSRDEDAQHDSVSGPREVVGPDEL